MLTCREERTGYIMWHQEQLLKWSCLIKDACPRSSGAHQRLHGLVQSSSFLVCRNTSGVLLSLESSSSPIPFLTAISHCLFLKVPGRPNGKNYLSLCNMYPWVFQVSNKNWNIQTWSLAPFCFPVWKQHVFFPTDSSKKTSQERTSHILTKTVLLQCSSHKRAYCFIAKPYLADRSFHNSHRIQNGKYMLWMAAVPKGLLKGQIIAFK